MGTQNENTRFTAHGPSQLLLLVQNIEKGTASIDPKRIWRGYNLSRIQVIYRHMSPRNFLSALLPNTHTLTRVGATIWGYTSFTASGARRQSGKPKTNKKVHVGVKY